MEDEVNSIKSERWGALLKKIEALPGMSSQSDSLSQLLEFVVRAVGQHLDEATTLELLRESPPPKELISAADNQMDAILVALRALAFPGLSRESISEEIVERVVVLFTGFLNANVAPLYDAKLKRSRTSAARTGGSSSQLSSPATATSKPSAKSKKGAWRVTTEAIKRFYPRLALSLECLRALAQRGLLSERHTERLLTSSYMLCGIRSKGIAAVQAEAISLVAVVYVRSGQSSRSEILDSIIRLYSALAHTDDRMVRRVAHFPLGGGAGDDDHIQVATALLLSVLQSTATDALVSGLLLAGSGEERQVKLKDAIKASYKAFESDVVDFVQRFLKTLSGDTSVTTTATSKVVLALGVDLINVLNTPEWPAAEYLLYRFSTAFAHIMKNDSKFQSLAINFVGAVCAKLKREAVALASAPIVLPDAEREFNPEGKPEDSGEVWGCVCDSKNSGDFSLDCDRCHRWFHGACVGIRKSQVTNEGGDDPEKLDVWTCEECTIRNLVSEQRKAQKKAMSLSGGNSGDGGGVADQGGADDESGLDEIMRQLLLNFLTRRATDDFQTLCARQLFLARSLCERSEPADASAREEDDDDILDMDVAQVAEHDEQTPEDAKGDARVAVAVEQWKPDFSEGRLGAELPRDRTSMLTRQLRARAPLAQSFVPLLRAILSCVGHKASATREKVLKALDKISSEDPSILLLDFVQRTVRFTTKDTSKSVRSAAIGLVGQYIQRHSELAPVYYKILLERLRDKGLLVRKTAIRHLYSVCQKKSCSDEQYEEICVHMAARVFDEDSIQREVVSAFSTLWVPVSPGQIADQKVRGSGNDPRVRRVVRVCGRAKRSFVLELFQRLEQCDSEAPGRVDRLCEMACANASEQLNRGSPLPKEVSLIRALDAMSQIRPQKLERHARSLLSAIQNGLSLGEKPSPLTKQLCNEGISTGLAALTRVIPYLTKERFLEDLIGHLKMLVRRGSSGVLQASIACLCTIVDSNPSKSGILYNIYNTMHAFLQKRKAQLLADQSSVSVQATAKRCLLSVGMCIKYFDFDKHSERCADQLSRDAFKAGGYASEAFKLLMSFADCARDEHLRRFALRGLFYVFGRKPGLLTGALNLLRKALDTSSTEMVYIAVMSSFRDFLDGEEEIALRHEDRRKRGNRAGGATADSDMDDSEEADAQSGRFTVRERDVSDSVIPSIVQNLLSRVLSLCKAGSALVRFEALSLACVAVQMGLVTPISCMSTVICLLTDPDSKVRTMATDQLTIIAEKHRADLKVRISEGLDECFSFQRSVNASFDAFNFRSTGSLVFDGISRLYSVLASERSDRIKFVNDVTDLLLATVSTTGSAGSSGSARHERSARAALFANILAMLPYSNDEPFHIIRRLQRGVDAGGSGLQADMEELTKETGSPGFVSKMKPKVELSVVYCIMLKLDHFLHQAYQITDEKWAMWTPHAPQKSAIRIGRRLEHMKLDLRNLPDPFGSSVTSEQLLSYYRIFVDCMSRDSVALQVSFRKPPRKSGNSRRKKSPQASPKSSKKGKGAEDEDWVPGGKRKRAQGRSYGGRRKSKRS